MYLTFDQVILVQDNLTTDTIPVYVRQHPNKGRVLTTDDTEVHRELGWGDPFEYGYIYEDANGNWCVIPHVWDMDDALLAKDYYIHEKALGHKNTHMDQQRHELPERITNDPRVGKIATHLLSGETAPIECIYLFADGYEMINIYNPQTGQGKGDAIEEFHIHEEGE